MDQAYTIALRFQNIRYLLDKDINNAKMYKDLFGEDFDENKFY